MKYVKPEFMVEEFVINESVATCTAGNDGSDLTPVGIDCVKTRHHHVFYDGCTSMTGVSCSGLNNGCDGIADVGDLSSTSGTVRVIKYDGVEYLVWPVEGGGRNSSTGVELLATADEIISALSKLYYNSNNTRNQVHAGRITGNDMVEDAVARSL